MKKRLDLLLVERGLAETRSQAQALLLAGRIRGHSKAGEQVEASAELTVSPAAAFVSRGGQKLAHALDALDVDVREASCLDLGASTGGFTDVLLQRGAARVIALDVGHGQFHERLRSDPRVTVLERVNARHLTDLPYPPELITCDVSFIGLELALPPALTLAAPGWRALVLVKPQFEAGRADAKGGVVRDPAVHRRVLERLSGQVGAWGASVAGVVDSGLPGPKGNREFFLYLVPRQGADRADDIGAWIDAAVGRPSA